MNAAMTPDAVNLLNSKPCSVRGFFSRSPIFASKGRVRMKTAQKRMVRLIFVRKYNSVTIAISPRNRKTPPPKPVPSLVQSPSAVPNVLERRIVSQ